MTSSRPRDSGVTDPRTDVVDDLLDHAPCGFLSFGEDGRIELINATLLEMLGYQHDEVVGRHVEVLLTVGSRIFFQTHWFPLLRLHGRAAEIFLMLRRQDGDDLGVLVNTRSREVEDRTLFDCILIEVQERKKYEDELLRAKKAAELAQNELEAQKIELQEANESLEEQAFELRQQQEQLQDQALELEEVSYELKAANDDLKMRNEEAQRLRGIAEEANRAKSTFLAVMSHELRTPLNAIAGYVEILEMGIHGPVTPKQQEALEKISRSERHLLRLINEILNLARIEAGHVDYEIETVSVEKIMAGVAAMIEPQMERKGVEFRTEIPPGLTVQADSEKAEQVLLNLLSNAMKFTPGGGRVTVDSRVAEDSGRVELRVIDTGVGIPQNKLENVFQPFVQVDVSRTRTNEGTGLGLAISRDLARGMGGDLIADSVPGQGSTFTLLLQRGSAGRSARIR